MAVFRWVSRISLILSAVVGLWRLWKTWHQRDAQLKV